MTKLVLSNDTTKKKLSLCTKLHYLENKYKEISAYVQISECSDIWIRVKNPFSLLDIPENKIRIHSGDQASIIHGVYNKYLIDLDELTLDNLRFDEDFIKVVEDGDKVYDDDYLRVVKSDHDKSDINIVDVCGYEIYEIYEISDTMKWHEIKIEFQYMQFLDMQDIDELKQFVDGTNYTIINVDGLGIYLDDTTRIFHQRIKEGDYIIKTKLNNIYVVNKETFDNMEVDND